MKFLLSYTVPCKRAGKGHNHWVAFCLYKRKRDYLVTVTLNNWGDREVKIATFFSEKLARSFCWRMMESVNPDLEKFDVKKLRLKR
jgi:hypothetical protein